MTGGVRFDFVERTVTPLRADLRAMPEIPSRPEGAAAGLSRSGRGSIDPLAPARGCILGILIGAAMWGAIFAIWWAAS